MKDFWFKRKDYGWGWTPVRWQGWVVLGLYILIIFGNFSRVDKYAHSAVDTLLNVTPVTLIATAIMILVCYATGESPRWSWGGNNRDKRQEAREKKKTSKHAKKAKRKKATSR